MLASSSIEENVTCGEGRWGAFDVMPAQREVRYMRDRRGVCVRRSSRPGDGFVPRPTSRAARHELSGAHRAEKGLLGGAGADPAATRQPAQQRR